MERSMELIDEVRLRILSNMLTFNSTPEYIDAITMLLRDVLIRGEKS